MLKNPRVFQMSWSLSGFQVYSRLCRIIVRLYCIVNVYRFMCFHIMQGIFSHILERTTKVICKTSHNRLIFTKMIKWYFFPNYCLLYQYLFIKSWHKVFIDVLDKGLQAFHSKCGRRVTEYFQCILQEM